MDKVTANTIRAMWAMTLVAGLEGAALYLGMDGIALATGIGILAGLGGLAGGVAVGARLKT